MISVDNAVARGRQVLAFFGKETRCSSFPDDPNEREYDDSHNWYEFRRHQYKCLYCGLVIGWPRNPTRVKMGLEPLDEPGYRPVDGGVRGQ